MDLPRRSPAELRKVERMLQTLSTAGQSTTALPAISRASSISTPRYRTVLSIIFGGGPDDFASFCFDCVVVRKFARY